MTQAKITVSVVTVVRNGARYLEHAIRSVLDQDYADVEYIIIDGGSTDGTLDIIRRYEPSLAAWISEPDRGVPDAFNKGISRASGQLIKLVNADDRLTPRSISKAVDLYRAHGSEPCVIASDVVLIDEHGRVLTLLDRSRAMNPIGPVLHPSWYVDRRVYEELGLYRLEHPRCSDFEIFMRFHRHHVPFHYTEAPLAEYRTGGGSGDASNGPDAYRIVKEYFGRPVALRLTALYYAKKFRQAALVRLLGEERTFRLRAALRPREHARLKESLARSGYAAED